MLLMTLNLLSVIFDILLIIFDMLLNILQFLTTVNRLLAETGTLLSPNPLNRELLNLITYPFGQEFLFLID